EPALGDIAHAVAHGLPGDGLPRPLPFDQLRWPLTAAGGACKEHLGHALHLHSGTSLHSAGLSSHIVTGPSFTRLTAICAPKAPCATGTPYRATAARNVS